MLKTIITGLLAVSGLLAQGQGSVVRIGSLPEDIGVVQIFVNSGANPTYVCTARSAQTEFSLTVSGATNANPGVFTSTHGFYYSATATATPLVKVAGGTSGWASANGVWKLIPLSSTTFKLNDGTNDIDTTAYGSFAAQTAITFKSTSPRWTAAVWSVMRLVYDGTPAIEYRAFGTSVPGSGSTLLKSGGPMPLVACSGYAGYAY